MSANTSTVPDRLGDAPHSKQSLRVWLRLLTCTSLIEKSVRLRLAQKFDTTLPRFDVMATLDRYPEGLTMGRLSEKLMVSNGNVTGVVTRLETEGLVMRQPLEEDRRTYIASLTPKGRKIFRKMAAIHEAWVDRLLADLSDKDMRTLLLLLDRVKMSVQNEAAPGRDA